MMLEKFLSADVIFGGVISLFFFCFIVAFFFRPEEVQKSRLYIFISVLVSAVILLLGLNLIVSTVSVRETAEVNRIDATKRAVDLLWLNPFEKLATSPHVRPEFIRSFFPGDPDLDPANKNLPYQPYMMEEQYISLMMIQSWEDFLITRRLIKTGDAVWFCSFLQWAQSPYLKSHFAFLKNNFRDTTIRFGELLFEYAEQLPIPTSYDNYREIMTKFMSDPRLKVILKDVETQ